MHTESKKFPRLLSTALLMAIIVLIIGGNRYYRAEQWAERQQAEKHLASIARLKVEQIATWRGERLADAGVLSENPFLTDAVARFLTDTNEDTVSQIRSFLHSLQNHYHYEDILLVDPSGRIHLSLQEKLHGMGYATALTQALGDRRPVFVDLHTEGHDSAPHVSTIAPIFADNGNKGPPLGAIILINEARQFLYPLIQSWPTPSLTAETLLVRRDGDAVLFLNNLRHQEDTALKLRIPLSRSDVPAVMAVLGQKGMVEGLDYRGIATLAFLLPVPDTPWFIIAKDNVEQVFAGWHARALLLMSLLVALAGCVVMFGLFARQRYQKARYRELYSVESKLRAIVERQSITLQAVGDGIIATNAQGLVELLNPVAETLTGWHREEACGRPLAEIFHIINEDSRERIDNPVAKVLSEGRIVGLANHTLLIAKNGVEKPIADSAAPICDEHGEIIGVVLVFRDQSKERRAERLIRTRLTLLEYALDHNLEELLTKTLDEIGALVASPIGFYHFVDADQKTLSLQQWSTQTLQRFCRTEGKGLHYDLDQAGVWADCLREGKAVVHNDYAALAHKKGMPEGHAEVIRQMVVPVIRLGKVVAVLGVGNKGSAYSDEDVELVSYLADVAWQLVEQKLAEEKIRSSEQRYRVLHHSLLDAFVVVDMQGKITECNASFSTMLGYSEEELKQLRYTDLTPTQWHEVEMKIVNEQILPFGCSDVYEKEYKRKDGLVFPVELRTFLIVNDQGQAEGMSAIVRDISERKWAAKEQEKLQTQLTQAQKMESVGRLAGGVAHDFNNMLGVILGYTEIALDKVDPADPLHEDLGEIFNAGKRSADLTRQLLAFARKQTIAPQVLDLNEAVESMLKMLRRLIGEDINLAWLPGRGLGMVSMDPSQIDQILANLCVNCRDAIAGVGKITIETGGTTFDAAYCADHAGFTPGEFIRLAVSDDGCGMDQETLDKLFEPFFTTKELGKGTGLGLATVYGIVKQNNGFINVYSEPGKGTTFKIYLPVHADGAEKLPKKSTAAIPAAQQATILVVEDEAAILRLTRAMLENLGYSVLTANSPGEALRLAEAHAGEIHLLITDVIMPDMDGRELAEQLHARFPRLKTLFMSGYTADVIAHRGILQAGVTFIHKPFSRQDLATTVYEVLGAK